MLDETDLQHLRRCVTLASEAVDGGNAPFGSLLVSAGRIIAEARNGDSSGDPTRHPELELAHWAIAQLEPAERAAATVYTSGEHCPMCSAAHAWAGLGRIVYAASTTQLRQWLAEFGGRPAPVRPLSINEVSPDTRTDGPAVELAEEIEALHRRRYSPS